MHLITTCCDDRRCRCSWSLVTEQSCAVGPHRKVSRMTGLSTSEAQPAAISSTSSTKSNFIYTKAFRNLNAVSLSQVQKFGIFSYNLSLSALYAARIAIFMFYCKYRCMKARKFAKLAVSACVQCACKVNVLSIDLIKSNVW